MDSLRQKQQNIIDDFAFLEDWTDKYNLLIDFGKTLPPINAKYKTDAFKVNGCQSQVWLYAHMNNGKIMFEADSDAIITKGLIGLLVQVYSNETPEEVLNTPLTFIETIGLHEHLSPTRSNGLANMIAQMKRYAAAFQNEQLNHQKS